MKEFGELPSKSTHLLVYQLLCKLHGAKSLSPVRSDLRLHWAWTFITCAVLFTPPDLMVVEFQRLSKWSGLFVEVFTIRKQRCVPKVYGCKNILPRAPHLFEELKLFATCRLLEEIQNICLIPNPNSQLETMLFRRITPSITTYHWRYCMTLLISSFRVLIQRKKLIVIPVLATDQS